VQNNSFVIIHQNIAGVLNKLNELELVLLELAKEKIDVDTICLTETFLKRGDESNVILDNYELRSHYSREKKRGGSCILCKRHLESTQLDVNQTFGIEKSFEVCAVSVKDYKTIIVCVYRTPDSDLNLFLNNLEALLISLEHKDQKIIICGDFNVDFLKPSFRKTQLCNILSSYGFKYHITQPTRQNSCIDNIVSNVENVVGRTHQLHLSDHNTAQSVEVKYPEKELTNYPSSIVRLKYAFWPEYKNKFVECINSLTFSDVYESSDVQVAFNRFHNIITLFFGLCFPLIRSKVTFRLKNPAWITKGIRKSCQRKRYLRQQYYLNKSAQNKRSVSEYSKILRRCISSLQKHCNKRYILNSENKAKATWNVINKRIGSTINNNDIVEIIDKNGDCKQDGKVIADTFNDFFVGDPNVKTGNERVSGTSFNSTNIKGVAKTIFLRPATVNEVQRIIMTLKNKKSSGFDSLTVECLKLVAPAIAKLLAHIINASFENGDFPDRLKRSVIKPLYKKGKKNDKNNYRPVALTPVLSKLFEKAMYNRLLEFLDLHKVLATEQFGFRRKKSTMLASFVLFKHVLNNLNAKIPTSCLFLDLSKAFDFVDHDILLNKLHMYGVRGSAFNWIQAYLRNRDQFTRITKLDKTINTIVHFDSNIRDIYRGVPQGSILGPLLFLVYVNDLPKVTQHKSVLFADDTTIVFKCIKATQYEAEVNDALRDIVDWLVLNKLEINIGKTKFLQFSTKKAKKITMNISYADNRIEEVDSAIFLGICVDKYITWNEHVDMLCKKMYKFIYALRIIRRTTSVETAITVYHAHVCSQIRYGIVLWGNSSHAHKVFVAQKKCLRAIWGLKNIQSCKQLFIENKFLTLPAMYIYEIAKLVKENLSLFHLRDNANRRAETHVPLSMPAPRLELYRKNCYYMATLVYNSIPKSISDLCYNRLCKTLRLWLEKQCFYSVGEFLHTSDCRLNRYR
jgi:hypothetical protein